MLSREDLDRRRDMAQSIFSSMGMKVRPVAGGCFLFAEAERRIKAYQPGTIQLIRRASTTHTLPAS